MRNKIHLNQQGIKCHIYAMPIAFSFAQLILFILLTASFESDCFGITLWTLRSLGRLKTAVSDRVVEENDLE